MRRPSPKQVALKTAEKVLQLCREKYFDFSVQHFHEKLTEDHGVRIGYTWVKMALQGRGPVNKQRHGDAATHRRQQASRFGDGRYYTSAYKYRDKERQVWHIP